MKLINLITTVCDEDKLSESEVIKILVKEIEEHLPDCTNDIYKNIYEKAYGKIISKELAEEVVKAMAVTDGSERENGQKWTYEQTTAVGNQYGIDWDKISKVNYYLVMNMVYSDNYATAQKYDFADDPEFYSSLAKDWILDTDIEDKLMKYVFKVIM